MAAAAGVNCVCLSVCLSVCLCVSSEDTEKMGDVEDCTASTWLQELGIDQSRYRSLDPAKIREYLLWYSQRM